MTTNESTSKDSSDEFDVLEAAQDDPPRIRDPDHFEAVLRFSVGSHAYVHSVAELSDGRLVCYLGVVKLADTTAGARGKERTFLNYGPIGALVAHPIEGGEYEVEIPDHDALDAAIQARRRRENDHRATALPPVQNMLETAVDDHAAAARDADDPSTAWKHAGMAHMASLVYAELTRRWDAAYKGRKRWQTNTDREVVGDA